MTGENEILGLIYQAIDELNDDLPAADRLARSPSTPLLGEGGVIDSIQLVNLVVATEELVEESYDRVVVLADDRAFSQARSPFLTVGSLAEYVGKVLRRGAEG